MEIGTLINWPKLIWLVLRDIVYFPLWWYISGLRRTALGVWNFWVRKQKALGLFIWLKNIFTPMYGQRDFFGKLISFVMRLVQIIFRGVLMLVYFIFGAAVIVFWILALPAWVYFVFIIF